MRPGAVNQDTPTVRALRHLAYTPEVMNVQEMVIYGVSFDVIGKQPIVLLRTMEGNRFLPIWIGHPEAAAILIKLQGTELPRPMTHDLLTSIIGSFHAEVTRITVTELKESTFYATLTLNRDGAEIEIDSRPSDALALAVRTEAPIFAATELIDENAIEFEREVDDTEQIVESFRDFLESVSPDDFVGAEATPDEIAFAEEEDDDDDEFDDDDDDEDVDDDDDEEGLAR
ncbi:MAG TPA: bifunctional nuclease family protein [Thermoleophilia bacterium]|nr:bifunctional nuclease family protein [Thermoleophilia bacterium]